MIDILLLLSTASENLCESAKMLTLRNLKDRNVVQVPV